MVFAVGGARGLAHKLLQQPLLLGAGLGDNLLHFLGAYPRVLFGEKGFKAQGNYYLD